MKIEGRIPGQKDPDDPVTDSKPVLRGVIRDDHARTTLPKSWSEGRVGFASNSRMTDLGPRCGYLEANGGVYPAQGDAAGLGSWSKNQRMAYRGSGRKRLPAKRIALLEQLPGGRGHPDRGDEEPSDRERKREIRVCKQADITSPPTVELLPRHVRHTTSYIWRWLWPCPGSPWMIERSAVQTRPSPCHGASASFFVDLPDGASVTHHLSARLARTDQLARSRVGERLPKPTRSLDRRTSEAGRSPSAFSSWHWPRGRTR